VRLLQSNNIGCRFFDDTEAIKLQLPNNRRLSCAWSPCQDESLHAFPIIAVAVDAVPFLSYKLLMICAFPRLMATTDSRGLAVGPEGMRVR
jgi:hypothetical protein